MNGRTNGHHASPLGFRGDRVYEETDSQWNHRVAEKMQANIQRYATGDPRKIDERIEELNREWDIERVLELNAAALAWTGLFLSLATGRKRYLVWPTVILPFLMQHAIQGWCPPAPLLRRLGIRTQREIEAEKYALKALQKERSRDL